MAPSKVVVYEDAYISQKCIEWGMTDMGAALEWLQEVWQHTYYTTSIVMPAPARVGEGILVLNSSGESTRKYHENVKEYETRAKFNSFNYIKSI